jgi:hypothetical protein
MKDRISEAQKADEKKPPGRAVSSTTIAKRSGANNAEHY